MALGRGSPRDVVGLMKGYGGGNWGQIYDPFQISCSDEGAVDIPALKLLEGLTPEHIADRRRLLGELDALQRKIDHADHQKSDHRSRPPRRVGAAQGDATAVDDRWHRQSTNPSRVARRRSRAQAPATNLGGWRALRIALAS